MSDTPETDAYSETDWWSLFRATEHCRQLERERDEARFERDEAMRMLGEQLYQRVDHWTEEFERLLGELNVAREEVSVLKAKQKEEA